MLWVTRAASSAGQSVLQLDPDAEYGSHWVGLTGDSFLQWAERQQRPAAPSTPASAVSKGLPKEPSAILAEASSATLAEALCSRRPLAP